MEDAATSSGWGPGRLVDPQPSARLVTCKEAADVPATFEGWEYRAEHVLPPWGKNSDDLAAVHQPDDGLRFAVRVRPDFSCTSCGSRDHVRLIRYHPGSCGAFEWTHGIDIDWRWVCCGKHESLCHERACQPNGYHKTGCVEAPLCSACFTCPCVALIASRKQQLEDLYG